MLWCRINWINYKEYSELYSELYMYYNSIYKFYNILISIIIWYLFKLINYYKSYIYDLYMYTYMYYNVLYILKWI